jgi:hypothetical protein
MTTATKPRKRKRGPKSRKSIEREYQNHLKTIARTTAITNVKGAVPTCLPKYIEADTNLCSRCAAIDFDNCFLKSRSSRYVMTHNSTKLPLEDSCSLCQFIRTIIPNEAQIYQVFLKDLTWKDLPAITQETMGLKISWTLSNLIVSPPVYIAPQPEENHTFRSLRPDSIDYAILKEWLLNCQKHHHFTCSLGTLNPVKFAKLIDCETRCIVSADNHPYVCLSYLWGTVTEACTFHDSLPQNLPATIEDSITLTRCLGMQYLWIDRYCIDQSEPNEVSHQVQMMDLIYHNAEITIIAAAGSDPFYGLPGVSVRFREAQSSKRIGKHTLFAQVSDPITFTQDSIWNTRGWTFQEARLSRRRLVFTNHEAYFECPRMNYFESLDVLDRPAKHGQRSRKVRFLTIDSMVADHEKDPYSRQKLAAPIDHGFGAFDEGIGWSPTDVFSDIYDYCDRQFSYDSDVLNGLLGIFRAYELRHAVKQHWGIPIYTPALAIDPIHHSEGFLETSSWFTAGLLWICYNIHRERGFSQGLSRRQGFPSWSWAGWKFQKKVEAYWVSRPFWDWASLLDCWQGKAATGYTWARLRVGVETTDGQVLWDQEFKHFLQDSKSTVTTSPFIHITGRTVPVHFRKLTSKPFFEVFLTLENPAGSASRLVHHCQIDCTRKLRSVPEECLAIHLCDPRITVRENAKLFPTRSLGQWHIFLIVGKICENHWERIGIACLNIDFYPELQKWETIRFG